MSVISLNLSKNQIQKSDRTNQPLPFLSLVMTLVSLLQTMPDKCRLQFATQMLHCLGRNRQASMSPQGKDLKFVNILALSRLA